jgi:HSP20 family molecular chaperone IbpA
MENSPIKYKKFIKTNINLPATTNLNSVSIDNNTGFITTRPDSFLPPVDIIKVSTHYIIVLEVAGLNINDITISR